MSENISDQQSYISQKECLQFLLWKPSDSAGVFAKHRSFRRTSMKITSYLAVIVKQPEPDNTYYLLGTFNTYGQLLVIYYG